MIPSRASSEDSRRTLSGGAVTVVGLLLLAVPLYDMWDDFSRLDWAFAVSALFLLVITVQMRVLNRPKPLVVALDGVVIGSVVTFSLGVLSTKSNIQQVGLRKEQKARASLESLFEVVNALQQAATPSEVFEIGVDGVDGVDALVSPATARVSIDLSVRAEYSSGDTT